MNNILGAFTYIIRIVCIILLGRYNLLSYIIVDIVHII